MTHRSHIGALRAVNSAYCGRVFSLLVVGENYCTLGHVEFSTL